MSRQNLPRWFDNDDFHCNHCGEVVETCFLPSLVLGLRPVVKYFVVAGRGGEEERWWGEGAGWGGRMMGKGQNLRSGYIFIYVK